MRVRFLIQCNSKPVLMWIVATSPEGYFTLPLLPVGTYELSARFRGFAAVKKTGITVAVGQTRSVDIMLKPSAVETSIEVEDEGALLDSVQFETSTHVDSREISRGVLHAPSSTCGDL